MHRRGGGARRREQDGGLVNLKAFFVATLSSALDLGIAAPDDVLRHVTPDVLAHHLPRPLWARLLTACVGAPRVDAQLVVETIGVPNLCEHVPTPIIWACIEEIGQRVLGGVVAAPASPRVASEAPSTNGSGAATSRAVPLATPPPPPAVEKPAPQPPVAVGPSIPAPTEPSAGPGDDRPRAAPGQRFRPSNTGIGRLATNTSGSRRPQAQAAAPTSAGAMAAGSGALTPASAPATTTTASGAMSAPSAEPAAERPAGRVRRGQTEADFDLETFVGGKDDWKSSLAVEDDQLVDWHGSDETVAGGDERKR